MAMAMKTKGGSAALKREHQSRRPEDPRNIGTGTAIHDPGGVGKRKLVGSRTRLTMAKGKASLRAGLPLYHACFR
jgi:hypothetical protein